MSVFVRDSGTHGMGVFTNAPIARGEFVSKFTGGRIFTWGHGIEPTIDLLFPEGHYLQVGATRFMEPVRTLSGRCAPLLEPVWYINHSCEPNLRSEYVSESEIRLVTFRDIAAGEELTWDYSTTMLDPDWQMECLCRKPSCRKTISDFATLPLEIRAKYRDAGGLPPYLKGV